MNDRDIERLLAGQAPDGDADLDALARFVEDVGRAYPEARTDALESAHVAAMVEATRLSAENGDPVARPASKAHGSASQASGLPKWRRNPMVKRLFGSPMARVATLAVGLMLVFSGVAVAGALPDQLQTPVSNAAQTVGIDLPCPDDDAAVDDADELDVSDEAIDADDADDLQDEKMDMLDAAEQAEEADDAADEAADAAEEASDKAHDAADEAADKDDDAADEAADQAEEAADQAQDQAEDAEDEAADQAEEAADQAEDAADDAADQAEDEAEPQD